MVRAAECTTNGKAAPNSEALSIVTLSSGRSIHARCNAERILLRLTSNTPVEIFGLEPNNSGILSVRLRLFQDA